MNFYDRVGKMAITSRLRRVSDLFAEDRRKIYQLYDVELDPKWFPVFYVLSDAPDGLSTTEIARQIDHSHASVSQIVKAMKRRDIVTRHKNADDARVNVIALSQRGRRILPKIKQQYVDVTEAVEELLAQSHSDLWHALGEIEFLLQQREMPLGAFSERGLQNYINTKQRIIPLEDQREYVSKMWKKIRGLSLGRRG